MNRKGFTLVELLATLVILGIVVGLVVVISGNGFKNAKTKSEDVFIATIEDALDIYVDSDARSLSFNRTNPVCTLNKTHGSVNVYKNVDNVTFLNVINSSYHPITRSELVNPANKGNDNFQCFPETSGDINYGTLDVYVDDDFVYYYRINKSDFGCLNTTGYITNLPSECTG